MSVKWRGAEVAKKMLRAEVRAINLIMSRCVRHAVQNHPDWKNQTGDLEGSLDIHSKARRQGSGAAGVWGSADIVYARFREFNPDPGYLRPAAAIHYPDLPGEIRRAFG